MYICNSDSMSFLSVYLRYILFTRENHCTRTAKSSCVGYSGRVHRIVYLANKKGNILVDILLLKIFFANYCYL